VADSRSVVASIVPRYGVGDSLFLLLPGNGSSYASVLLAILNSFVFDYVARQKASGANLNYYVMKQLPALEPHNLQTTCPWIPDITIFDWIQERTIELTYTAWDLQSFANDCGWFGSPFEWDDERRFLLRSELDAAFFHLYLGSEAEWCRQSNSFMRAFPTPRHAVDYILDTFPVVKRKDEQAHGEYRTKRVILEIYDEMKRAMETSATYRTRLDPPPANDWTPPELPQEEAEEKSVTQAAMAGAEQESDLFAWRAEDPQQAFIFDDKD